MIVKNEHHIVLDALRSVRAVADHWVVLDTGSTDGTLELLREFSDSEWPGTLAEGPFIDFSNARNRLFDLAEPTCDWMVIIDADMAWDDATALRLEIETAHADPRVDGFKVKVGDVETYWHVRVFRTGRGWRYKYRTHEIPGMPTTPYLFRSRTTALHFATGGSRANKYTRDLELIKLDLADNPNDHISHYYLAGTYRALQRPRDAIKEYRRMISLDPDDTSEAVYISRFVIANLLQRLGAPDAAIEDALLEAATTRPGRYEARCLLYRRLNDSHRFQGVLDLERLLEAAPKHATEEMFVRDGARSETEFELARAYFALGNRADFTKLRERLVDDANLSVELRGFAASWPAT